MNRTKIKNYAPQARRDFIQAVTDRAAFYGLTEERTEPVTVQGDVALISGRAFPREVAEKRKALQERIKRDGFGATMEALAYTWFNRLVAIRYMELHEYLDHGYRVLSNPDPAKVMPEILEHAEHVEMPGLNRDRVVELKLDGTKEAELYRLLLVAQCNALHSAMPFLFEQIGDETELVLPESLLHTDSIVRKLVSGIDEEDWREVEIIGWLYEAYISERYEQVIGKVVASADIPAATQRFTPKWIVRYLVQNTLGRQWMATYPQSPLKGQMKYYIEPAEQTPEVQEQLRAITPTSLNPEEITFLDPACGSAHILVEAYDLFKTIYQERGYRAKDIPRLILSKNLFGLEIDDRAAQLAAFALMMKARADDRRIFDQGIQPHVRALVQTDGMDAEDMAAALNVSDSKEPPPPGQLFETEDNLFTRAASTAVRPKYTSLTDVSALVDLFQHAKTFGSLIQVPPALAARLPQIEQRCGDVAGQTGEIASRTAARFLPVIEQARMLAGRYDCVVANPPYMGNRSMNGLLKELGTNEYPNSKSDLFAMFIERGFTLAADGGLVSMVAMQSWMFLPTYYDLRSDILKRRTLETLAHLGPRAFGSISGEVVQVAAFSSRRSHIPAYRPTFFRLVDGDEQTKETNFLHRKNVYQDARAEDFFAIPGCPITYWMPTQLRTAFLNPSVESLTEIEGQNKTAENDTFLRLFWEVSQAQVGRGRRWLPYAKGGELRRWYGNIVHVVDWSESARRHYRSDPRCRIIAERFWYRKGITWTDITSSSLGTSFRVLPEDTTFDMSGPSVFLRDDSDLEFLLGLLNSSFTKYLLPVLNPTLHVQLANVKSIPLPPSIDRTVLEESVRNCVAIAKEDWDSQETSLDFQMPGLMQPSRRMRLAMDYESIALSHGSIREKLAVLETGINERVARAFGLRDEIETTVPVSLVTITPSDKQEEIKRLISNAVGCTMGRYSLDKPGLIYALGGNVGFDPGQYKTFPADQDGIVPVMEADWFADDAAHRFVEFLGVAWPREGLDENLKFVADALSPSKGEQPRDTIRRYLATGFYKHHLQTYKRRPIYWLFSSGKQRAFQCLVYLHRYHEGTLSRMRTEYVIPLQGKLASRIDQLAADIPKATSTSHRNKLTKERDALLKQQAELQAYDEKLRHYADMRIALDLDDGVKVNYGKFSDLLAEMKAVTGGRDDE